MISEPNVTTPQNGTPALRHKPKIFMMDLLATVPYYTAYLSRALLLQGLPVTVGSITYYLDPGCFSTRQIKVNPGLFNLVGNFSLPRTLRRVLKLAEAIANMAVLALHFFVAPPAIIHVQYLPMLQWSLPLDAWFLAFCQWRGCKTVLTVHDLLPQDATSSDKQVFIRLYSSVGAVICHSEHVRRRLVMEFAVPEAKVAVIPHGPFFYDLPDFSDAETQRELQVVAGEQIVLWQGIIFPYKGLDVLLDAWRRVEAQVPHARLVVVGTGAPHLLDQIREQQARLGLERVTLLFRFAGTEQLVSIYRAADIVVYPYREITTSGALATGLALGKAIVASDLPVFRELLTSGKDALLVEPNDAAKLGEALIKLLQDQALRDRFVSAVAAMKFGAQSWTSIATQTMAVYDSVLAKESMLL